MKDNEIIKALQEHYINKGDRVLIKNTLDLINRKNAEIVAKTEEYNDMLEQRNRCEEEIEKLKTGLKVVTDELTSQIIRSKSEAIKEFWDKLRTYMQDVIIEYDWTGEIGGLNQASKFIPYGNNLVKEMMENDLKEIKTNGRPQ